MTYKTLLLQILFSYVFLTAYSQPEIELVPFASGLSNPIDIADAGDERLFIVQQRGLIRIINSDGTVQSEPFLDLSGLVSQSANERGLLGLAFHPEYSQNGYFFVNYTRTSDGATVVARFSVDADDAGQADPESLKIVMTIQQPYSNHNGGNILFGPDGYLYIAVGDGGHGGDPDDYAQTHTTHLGKMLRIAIDVEDDEIPYLIPEDNPFAWDDFTLDEIWALGLRNHWRNSFDRYTGDLWIADVGQSAREEINFQPADSPGGENYGWRCYEGNIPYNLSGCGDEEYYTFPVFDYEHEGSGCSGSVTGGYVYRGALYNGLYGVYLAADYCTGKFYMVQQTEDGFEGSELGTFTPFQYATFGEDQYGELYISLRGAGEIQKITEVSDCRPVAKIMEEGSFINLEPGDTFTLHALYHPNLDYQWLRDAEPMPGESSHILEVTESGVYSVEVTNPENTCSNVSETFEVEIDEPTIITADEIPQFIIYPNPAGDHIIIEGLPTNQLSYLVLTDLSGRMVINELALNSGSHTLRLGNLPAGVYLLGISIKGSTSFNRIVIQ
ncbi:MAG: T9SS C-terminal target domain-containing protein [Bacteroidetes bacterium]|nr:MAG: T9SS C-terminal target domain-containing protein [Bacteroidota bacterium]